MLLANEGRHYQEDISFYRRLDRAELSGCFHGIVAGAVAVAATTVFLPLKAVSLYYVDKCVTLAVTERYELLTLACGLECLPV